MREEDTPVTWYTEEDVRHALDKIDEIIEAMKKHPNTVDNDYLASLEIAKSVMETR